MAQESAFLAKSIPYSLDEKATEILQPDTLPILRAVNDAFANITTFDAPTVEAACKDVANAHAGGKLGKVGMPLRAALTGTGVSPTIFTAAAVLGQDECVSRLNDILARLA
jgi:glutamyl-tRNA synthetase